MSLLSALQLFRIFEIDCLRLQVSEHPDFVNTARLTTVLETISVIRDTPLISATEADYLIDMAGAGLVSEKHRPAQTSEYHADFGTISTFVDLTSDLVTDYKIHAFLRTLNQRGAKPLYGDLVRLNSGLGISDERQAIKDYQLGILHFLQLMSDFADFNLAISDVALDKSLAKCLLPWFSPEVALFFRSVEDIEKTSFSTAAVEQGKELISLTFESSSAQLAAIQGLFERVHQGVAPSSPVTAASPTVSVPPSIVSEELQRVEGRMSTLTAERTKLAEQLDELEIAERVLARFRGSARTIERRKRRRTESIAPSTRWARRVQEGRQAPSLSLSDATLGAIKAFPGGATASEVLGYLTREFGMAVRPNHLGIALQRHRRAGRLENRDQRWFSPGSAEQFGDASDLIA